MKNNIVVTSNVNPDLDGYASAIGYAELLNKQNKNAQAVLLGEPLAEVKFILKYLEIENTVFQKNIEKASQIVLVDVSSLDTVDKSMNPKQVTEIIDHRPVNDSHLYPWAKIQIELVGACATLIVEKYQKAKIEPSRIIATCLYGAIASNTINFKNKITTQRDIQAAKYLKKIACLPDNFVEKMFLNKSDFSGNKLDQYIKHDYIDNYVAGKHITIFQIETANIDILIKNRLGKIIKIINDTVEGKNLDFYFINIIDILKGYNYIITPDKSTKKLLEDILKLEFHDNIAKTDYIIMRKEIVAKIKDRFESNVPFE